MVEHDFIFSSHGPAWQLDRVRFEHMLLSAATEAGAQVKWGAPAREPRWIADRWEIDLDSMTVRTPWIVDATGRRASLARSLGGGRIRHDTLISLYVTASSHDKSDRDGRTFIEASAGGWWYSALMPNGKRTIAFQTDVNLAKDAAWRDSGWFRTQVMATRHLSALLADRYSLNEAARLAPAHSARLRHFVGPGWVAVGDAAQSFDPLSGHGLLAALQSGQRAGEALAWQSRGDADALPHYVAWLNSVWGQFWEKRSLFYAMETRWPESNFWHGRCPSATL